MGHAKRTIGAAALTAFAVMPSAVAALEVVNCKEMETANDRWKAAVCDVRNNTERAVPGFFYDAILRDPRRDTPWDALQDVPVSIRGGIEPGETVPVVLRVGNGLPERADADAVTLEVTITGPYQPQD